MAAGAYFDEESFSFTIDGEEVSYLQAKGASAAIARDSGANLSIIIQQLQNDVITLQEAYDSFKRETKLLHMAEYALANGGIDQVTDWGPVERIIEEQWNGNDEWPGLRSFFEDVAFGRYGTQQLSPAVLSRGLNYANAGRETYENQRLAARMNLYELDAKRLMGGVETHCQDCPNWARLGWIEAAVMHARYAIGMSRCKVGCYCVIVTRRAAVDVANAVGKNAVLALMQTVAKAGAGAAGALVAALALMRYSSNNPTAFRFALSLLLGALEPRRN